MKIDSHHHLWTIARGDYFWMSPELGEIYRDFVPADLDPLRKAAGIDRTIIVQAADTLAETEFLLETAGGTDWIAGVVGWIDMESPDAVADLQRLAKSPCFKGIRPMIQEIEDDDWILRPGLDHVFDALVAMNLTFDALVLPRHLPRLLRRLDKHPNLQCVIDHAAKPELATGNIEGWKRDIASLARQTNCLCKFSGLVTEAGPEFTIDTIRPAAEHIISVFGAERLMFGSDWPVLNLAGDYQGWVQMATDLTSAMSDNDKARFWGETAAGFYNVE